MTALPMASRRQRLPEKSRDSGPGAGDPAQTKGRSQDEHRVCARRSLGLRGRVRLRAADVACPLTRQRRGTPPQFLSPVRALPNAPPYTCVSGPGASEASGSVPPVSVFSTKKHLEPHPHGAHGVQTSGHKTHCTMTKPVTPSGHATFSPFSDTKPRF